MDMSALVTAAAIGAALFTLAIWVEIRERRAAPGYQSSGKPDA
jgi:hypothetical protein